MSSRSAAVYGTCGVVLIACLAAANMPSQDSETGAPPPVRPAPVAPDAIAADVQSQAARLHSRMADAPLPAAHVRNPFAFGERPMARRAASRAGGVDAPVAPEAVVTPSEPALLLMGIAEDTTPSGPHRTAIIGGEGDAIFMVTEGESFAGRYKVAKIGADAIELEDQTTKGYRRLALR